MKQIDRVILIAIAKRSCVFFAIMLTASEILVGAEKSGAKAHSAKEHIATQGAYKALLAPLDIFAPPADAKKLLPIGELYSLVRSRGVVLKVSRQNLNAANQTLKTDSDKKLPTISLDLGHQDSWSKTKSDSDPTDGYTDRKDVYGSRRLGSTGGLTLSGAPTQGITYKLAFPNLANSQTQPETSHPNPPTPDRGELSGSVQMALLKDNPMLVESLNRKKTNLTLSVARETFRSETLKAINTAEASYYGLIQKYLQLSVQRRALMLAKALENDVKEKVVAGESSALEATRAELSTVQTETDLMSSEIDYEAAVEEFRNSLSFNEDEGHGVFPDPKALDINLDDVKISNNAAAEVRKSNPEIAIAHLNAQSSGVDLELARKSTLPSLGFSASYGNSTPGQGWGKTSVEALRPNDRVFSVGLTYSQILYNDTSKNSIQQAIVAKQKSEYSIDEAEKNALKQYFSLVKKLDIGTRKLKIAKISREMAERKLSSEYEKFNVGESNVRNVIDSQTEVNSARITEIGARVDLLTGLGQMRTLVGKLPDGHTMNYSAAPGIGGDS